MEVGWTFLISYLIRHVDVDEDNAIMVGPLRQRVIEQSTDAGFTPLSSLCFNRETLPGFAIRGGELAVSYAAIPFILKRYIKSSPDECCRHENFVPCTAEVVAIPEPG